jgi:hypothetical protein
MVTTSATISYGDALAKWRRRSWLDPLFPQYASLWMWVLRVVVIVDRRSRRQADHEGLCSIIGCVIWLPLICMMVPLWYQWVYQNIFLLPIKMIALLAVGIFLITQRNPSCTCWFLYASKCMWGLPSKQHLPSRICPFAPPPLARALGLRKRIHFFNSMVQLYKGKKCYFSFRRQGKLLVYLMLFCFEPCEDRPF